MKKFLKVFILFFCLILVGCNNNGNSNESSSIASQDNQERQKENSNEKNEEANEADDNNQDELVNVSVAQPVYAVLWGPFYLADSLGFFEEEGLNVEFISVTSDVPTAPVISGDVEFGLFGPEMIYSMNEKGQGAKLLATGTKKMPYSLISSPEFENVEDLKGATIAADDAGSSGRQFVRAALSEAGLDPDTDVQYVSLKNNSTIPPALESGEIQAAVSSPEVRKVLLDQGNNLLVDMYDEEVHEAVLGSPYYEMYITFTTDEFIEQHPELCQSYVNAIYKAIQWVNEASVEEITQALQPYFSDMGEENLQASIQEIIENDLYTDDGTFSQEGHQAITQIAKSAGLLNGDLPQEQVADQTFINNAKINH